MKDQDQDRSSVTNKDLPCICSCHTKGLMVVHQDACCSLTYKKYINQDGTMDWAAYTYYKKAGDQQSFIKIAEENIVKRMTQEFREIVESDAMDGIPSYKGAPSNSTDKPPDTFKEAAKRLYSDTENLPDGELGTLPGKGGEIFHIAINKDFFSKPEDIPEDIARKLINWLFKRRTDEEE